ncbi:small, acid-soluble spore protein [Bacillus sp. JCM 19045]|nr:small, acid-soluble spore protein [Bacillus sp. JCM 19045]
MSRRRGVMSDRLKEELAKELGFYDTVQKEGWGEFEQEMLEIWSNVQ